MSQFNSKWEREREQFHLSSTFLFYSAIQQIRWCPFTLVRFLFLQLVHQLLISSRNTLTGVPRNILSAVWASFSSVKLTWTINHCQRVCVRASLRECPIGWLINNRNLFPTVLEFGKSTSKLPAERTKWEAHHLWTRKWILTRFWICWQGSFLGSL